MNELRLGDCLIEMKDIPDGSIDSVITDPPYGLNDGSDELTDVFFPKYFNVFFPQFNKIVSKSLNLTELPLPADRIVSLDRMNRAFWKEPSIGMPESSVDLYHDFVGWDKEVKDTCKPAIPPSDGRLMDKLNAHRIENGNNFFLKLRRCVDSPLSDSSTTGVSESGFGRLGVAIVIPFDSCFASLLRPLRPTSSSCIADIVRLLNDPLAFAKSASAVVTARGTELRAMLTFDLTDGSAELNPANGAREFDAVFEIVCPENVGAISRTGGLSSMFQATNFSLVDGGADGAFTINLHKFMIPYINKKSSGFMGKHWDKGVPGVEFWVEMIRVLKPGGYLLSFSGCRTYHRMAVAIEDAGFEIRDMIEWVYGSGFSKSYNLRRAGICTCGTGGNATQYIHENTKHDLRPLPETNLPQTECNGKEQDKGLQSQVQQQVKGASLSAHQGSDSKTSGENDWEEQPSVGRWKLHRARKGLPNDTPSEASESESKRLCSGTPISSGEDAGETTDTTGGGSPQGQGQAQQQTKQSENIRDPQGALVDRTLQGRGCCTRCGKLKAEYEGWGSALKPSHEPICMARKPLSEKTIAENVLKWGTGGINVDQSRVGTNPAIDDMLCKVERKPRETQTWEKGSGFKNEKNSLTGVPEQGRFPANLIHDNSEEVRECFPDSNGSGKARKLSRSAKPEQDGWGMNKNEPDEVELNDAGSGNASRFFKAIQPSLFPEEPPEYKSLIYQAKASKSERNKGLDGYLTVKHDMPKIGGVLCKEENMVAVQLLQKVMSESIATFNIGESGESITAQCHRGSLSTTLTEINKIIESRTLSLLTHLLTNESTQDVNSEMEAGGNLAESVADLKRWLLTITKGNQELALGVSRVVSQMLLKISEEENWKPATNFHSTVKPIALMEYLISMITQEGGTVLDPFMGSGTTGVAAKNLNRNFIGIELDPEYFKIAENRIKNITDYD